MLQLKRDPCWLKSLQHNAGTVIFLQGDDPRSKVSIPATLLLAISPLVRHIISGDHLPAAFSTPVISIPSSSLDILESVGKLMISGLASVDIARQCGVSEVLKMMGIEAEIDIQKTDSVGDLVFGKIVDVTENLMDIKSEECVLNAKTEIAVKLEIESLVEDTDLLNQNEQFSKTDLKQEKGINQLIFERPIIICKSVLKKLQVPLARFNHDVPEGNQDKSSKKTSSRNIKLSRMISCQQCRVMIPYGNLLTHNRQVHQKVQCPHCDKTLYFTSLKFHIKSVHKKVKSRMISCPQCQVMIPYGNLLTHNRQVHHKVQCPHCDKTLNFTSLKFHIKSVHNKVKSICPYCEKKYAGSGLPRHIKEVHNKETVPIQCPQCDKTLNFCGLSSHIKAVHI